MSVRWVPIGDVASMLRSPIEIEPTRTYRRVGIYSWAKGFIHRSGVSGEEMGSLRYFTFPDRALMLSNIQAWEGAIAVTGRGERDFVASNRFLPYVPTGELDVNYWFHFLASRMGMEILQKSSPGTTMRNRTLRRELFEAAKIPLPDIDTQRAIAARLDKVAERSYSLAGVVASAAITPSAVAPRIVATLLENENLGKIRIGDLCSQVHDVIHPGNDLGEARRFVGLEHIAPHLGLRSGEAGVEGLTGRKLRFAEGDVLFGYLRPYLNKVWVADGPGLCSVEQYVLRPRPGVESRLLAHVLRSQATLNIVNAHTHNLQLPRIRAGLLAAIEVPNIVSVSSPVAERLDGVNRRAAEVAALVSRSRDLAASLLPAARNEEFRKLLAD